MRTVESLNSPSTFPECLKKCPLKSLLVKHTESVSTGERDVQVAELTLGEADDDRQAEGRLGRELLKGYGIARFARARSSRC